jgi:hypothetical protein
MALGKSRLVVIVKACVKSFDLILISPSAAPPWPVTLTVSITIPAIAFPSSALFGIVLGME